MLLLLAARRAHLQQTILPALARGEWYISDRYRDATYAYQHYGRGIPLTTLSALETASETDRASLVVRANDPNGMMRDVAEKLTPKQIEAVARYMQGLH